MPDVWRATMGRRVDEIEPSGPVELAPAAPGHCGNQILEESMESSDLRTGKIRLQFARKRKRKMAPSWADFRISPKNRKNKANNANSHAHQTYLININNARLTIHLMASISSLIMIMILIYPFQVTNTVSAKNRSALKLNMSLPDDGPIIRGHHPLSKVNDSRSKQLEVANETSIVLGSSDAIKPHQQAGRFVRASGEQANTLADSTTRLVAVSGQWVELQCPFASELLAGAAASSSTAATTTSQARPGDRMVVWRRNGVSLSHLDPRYRLGALNGSLVLAGAQPKIDEGDYECALGTVLPGDRPGASSSAPKVAEWPGTGSRIHRFQLKLLVPPRLAPFEFPRDAQVGMKLVLTCSALEGQQPISFVWLKDNQIIWSGGGGSSANAPRADPGNQEIMADGGSNKQQKSSSLGQVHGQQLADKLALSSSHRISLAELASSIGSESSAADNKLKAATTTNEQSSPLSLLSDPNIRISQSDDYSILSIERLELKHTGRYTCSAQNEAARTTSHSSQLLINAPPSLTIEPQDDDLVSGQSSVIDCAASGQPRPTISWLRARESTSRHWDYVPVYDNLRYTSLANGSLAIANITQREQGYYLCSAKNGFGPEVTKLIKITVHEPAKFSSKYQTIEVRLEERANMVCGASGELPIAFEWLDKEGNPIQKSDKRFIIDHDPQDIIGGGRDDELANRSGVSRLMLTRSGRADSGHYTCQASNKYGSDKMVINLLVQDVPDKVTELKVTNVTATTISVRWQLAFSGNSPITSYLVQYQSDDPLDDLLTPVPGRRGQTLTGASTQSPATSLNDRLAATTSSQQQQQTEAAQSPTSALRAALDALSIASNLENADEAIDRTLVELTVEQSATHLVVKDLSPYCVYRLRLAGINKIGLGEFSDWIRAKTEEAPPSGSALKISAAATGPNSIKVTWSPPDRRSWNGQLIGFNIGYRPIDSGFELNKTIEWSPPSFQSIMLNADAKTTAANKQLQRTSSISSLVQDSNDAIKTGGSQQQQTGGSDLATTVKAASESQYILRQHLRQLLALQQQELVAHLTNLQRSTTYLVWIQAVNTRGFGPQSHAISIKTLEDVPPSAPAIKIQSTSPNSITVAWSMLSNFISSANQYSLFYRRLPQAGGPNTMASTRFLPPSNPNNASLPLNHQIDQLPEHNQLFGGGAGTAGHQPIEPGPFIERTMSSQQLMVAGGNFVDQQHDPSSGLLLVGEQVKPSFMLHQQSQQPYQQFVYTLDQLECGSVYELYMTTRNSVGKSEPSATVTTRTMGEPPLAPTNKNSLFAKIGANDVALNLAAWSTGGCPITHATARYKQVPLAHHHHQQQQANAGSNTSAQHLQPLTLGWPITTNVPASILAAVNGQQLHQQQASNLNLRQAQNKPPPTIEAPTTIHLLKNLMPSTAYELEVIAFNAAGHTSAQYEFVTSNANGTRAGFSRKEGVYRIDQRGIPIDHQQNLQPTDGGQRPMEQPFTNQSGAGAQLLPIILMVLCFVCLIISSAFCYNRLTDSWKRPRRSSECDPSSGGGGGGRPKSGSMHCNNSSPMSKSSMVWRLTNSHHANHPLQDDRNTFGKQHGATNGTHLDDSSTLEPNDSPSTVHYCMREPSGGGAGNQMHLGANSTMNEPKVKSSSFSQSVSMKDFNLALAAQGNPTLPRGINSSTLNFKAHRQRSLAMDGNKTMRSRLINEPIEGSGSQGQPSYDPSSLGQQLCTSSYGAAAGNFKQKQSMDGAYMPVNQLPAEFGNGNGLCGDTNHQCNYTVGGQQQETSWTNYGTNQQQIQYMKHHATTYAVPAAAINYNDHPGTYGTNQQQQQQNHLDYGQENYNQNNIDACIQQLMGQQYQQQEQQHQQQQYAVIINQKANIDSNKCFYGNDGFSSNQQDASQQNVQANLLSNNVAQSMIDSSSSSSGIDVGHHMDCFSTATGTSNSNASNNGYHLTQVACEPQDYGKDSNPMMAKTNHD